MQLASGARMHATPLPRAGEARHMRELAGLVRLVREMGGRGAADEFFEPALAALEEIVGVARSSILLLDRDGVARFKAWRGISDGYRAAVEGHFPWQLDDPNPQPIQFADVAAEPSLVPFKLIFEKEHISALCFIPLVYRERLIGKFMLYVDRPHVFRAEEIELAQAIAYLIAFAIERTRLYSAVQESERRKDAFLATLAHELRNPLAPASAVLALMAERPEDLAVCHHARQVLERNIGQIVKLVDDLLDVSRITRGAITLEKQAVELTSVVNHAVSSVQGLIAAQHQHLTLTLDPLWVEADPLRLEQVITNLIHNAAKYTPSGGHISVKTGAENGGVVICVRDDGIGLDPQAIPGLFDLFVQADQSLARTQSGLGIGLTIVRELVQLHGGTVSVVSAGKGRGAEFTVRLPGRTQPQRAVTKTARRHAHGPHRRVLIVDDNGDAADTLALLLQAWGHEVSTAPDGASAIEAVAAQHPDLILLDIGLPGMTGYEVAQHLRASGENDVQIVAVSGYGRAEDIERARASGCDGHLAKPVDLRNLERVLEQPHVHA
jgi:signal transduction histidine kinase/ActR/RegA family two-component response regulator